jgi:hypothetical protein
LDSSNEKIDQGHNDDELAELEKEGLDSLDDKSEEKNGKKQEKVNK